MIDDLLRSEQDLGTLAALELKDTRSLHRFCQMLDHVLCVSFISFKEIRPGCFSDVLVSGSVDGDIISVDRSLRCVFAQH